MFTFYIVTGIIVFLVCSTSYVPKRLIASIEKAYNPIELNILDPSKHYYIHVLGSGATNDSRLPASMNLNSATLSRLVEGIRIYNHLNHGVLVTSAASIKSNKSQAETSMEAAVSLGVKRTHINMLKTPHTTLEEAMAFIDTFGKDKNIILVTSALHMPRAIEIFKDQDLKVMPAPSNYLYKVSRQRYNGLTLPSFSSLELMNVYHMTILKQWYYKIFKKKERNRRQQME